MFPLPISTWIMVGLSALALAGFGYGKYQHNQYVEFKAEVIAAGKAQEANNVAVKKQSDLISKGIKNEYEAKLSSVRNYYGGLQHSSTSGSKLSGISNPASGTNETASYYQLAESCSETTLQTLALQDWILQQAGIK